METKIDRPPITHEMIQLALEKFFNRGGKIIETEDPYGNTPVKQSFGEKELKIIDPDLENFINIELDCGKSKIKVFKPDWI